MSGLGRVTVKLVCAAVWPAPASSSDTCQRRLRDTSQQTYITDDLQPDYHLAEHRQVAPHIKSEHLSPPMTSSCSVTSRGTSPLDVTLHCSGGEDGSQQSARRRPPLSLSTQLCSNTDNGTVNDCSFES